jgi:hypothetical protein
LQTWFCSERLLRGVCDGCADTSFSTFGDTSLLWDWDQLVCYLRQILHSLTGIKDGDFSVCEPNIHRRLVHSEYLPIWLLFGPKQKQLTRLYFLRWPVFSDRNLLRLLSVHRLYTLWKFSLPGHVRWLRKTSVCPFISEPIV